MKFEAFRMAGRQFHFKDALSVWGEHVCKLEREPENPADSNAIAVYLFGRKVGYVQAEAAKNLAKWLDKPEFRGRFSAKLEVPRQFSNSVGVVVRSVNFDPEITVYLDEPFPEEEEPPKRFFKPTHSFKVAYSHCGLATDRGTLVYYRQLDKFGIWDGTMRDQSRHDLTDFLEVKKLSIYNGCAYPLIMQAEIHGDLGLGDEFMLKLMRQLSQ